MHGSNSLENPLKKSREENPTVLKTDYQLFISDKIKFYRASRCQRIILLKMKRKVSLSNSSIEMILKCLRKRGVTLLLEKRGDSIAHIICTLDGIRKWMKNDTDNSCKYDIK